jgi:hypothetical protein
MSYPTLQKNKPPPLEKMVEIRLYFFAAQRERSRLLFWAIELFSVKFQIAQAFRFVDLP